MHKIILKLMSMWENRSLRLFPCDDVPISSTTRESCVNLKGNYGNVNVQWKNLYRYRCYLFCTVHLHTNPIQTVEDLWNSKKMRIFVYFFSSFFPIQHRVFRNRQSTCWPSNFTSSPRLSSYCKSFGRCRFPVCADTRVIIAAPTNETPVPLVSRNAQTRNIHKTTNYSFCLFCTIILTGTFVVPRIHDAWLRPSTGSPRDRDSVFFFISVRGKADVYIWSKKKKRTRTSKYTKPIVLCVAEVVTANAMKRCRSIAHAGRTRYRACT